MTAGQSASTGGTTEPRSVPDAVKLARWAVGLALLLAIIGIACVWWLPTLIGLSYDPVGLAKLGSSAGVTADTERFLKAQTELRKSLIDTAQLVTGAFTAVGLVFTLYFTATSVRQAERSAAATLNFSREAALTERLGKVIEELGSAQDVVKAAAFLELARIAREAASEHWAILELTCLYLQHRRPRDSTEPPTIDIKAAAKLIREAVHPSAPEKGLLNLSGANLHLVDLTGAKLPGANLRGAKISGTKFDGADLTDADLTNADGPAVILSNAILKSTILTGAILERAILDKATVTEADLTGAILTAVIARKVIGTPKGLTAEQISSAAIWDPVSPKRQ